MLQDKQPDKQLPLIMRYEISMSTKINQSDKLCRQRRPRHITRAPVCRYTAKFTHYYCVKQL